MRVTVTNTVNNLGDLIKAVNITGVKLSSVYIQNTGSNDVWFDNKDTNVNTEGIVLKSGNENVYDFLDLNKIFVQTNTGTSTINFIFQ